MHLQLQKTHGSGTNRRDCVQWKCHSLALLANCKERGKYSFTLPLARVPGKKLVRSLP